ncbi:hypothetical protein AK812_SmicGene21575 [Symbiodinium microadriaticum]|uniref:Uncharacterized protein n=1 Tax=Symbiodinium microadriaticum TaxID=2951 RepID=A0A1Q9DM18_SYMMI|nr:hypothetical protein AK812_SmicGene21575 [Symbiodinium microadriaticum]
MKVLRPSAKDPRFTGADTTLNWEAPVEGLWWFRGSTVDLWSWQPVSFAEPRYGDEWNGAHEVKVLKYQFFELFADLGLLFVYKTQDQAESP